MSDAADHDHVIDTGKGEFALSELGHLMPGMAEIMPLVGGRIWKCYYAGKAQNKALARFQLSEAVNLMEKGAFLRPKYAENMEKFLTGEVADLSKAIESEDWDALRAGVRRDGRRRQRVPRDLRQGLPPLEGPVRAAARPRLHAPRRNAAAASAFGANR